MTTNLNIDYNLTKQLHVLTLNVNGLHNGNKRMEIFQNIINKNIDITFLQETRTTPEVTRKWEKQWKGRSLWHSEPILKASGVAILFKENLAFEIINSETDLNGQILKCIIQFEQNIYQLINIYAPTKPTKKPIFYQKLSEFFEKGNNTILVGDFNMIEDKFLDKLGGNTSNTHLIGLNHLTEIKKEHNLVDIWRKHNPIKRTFTFHNHDKTIHSRLDRIYISKTTKTKTCKIIHISLTDHDGVSVILQVSEENPRGPGIWKLNTSILKQKQFQEIFKIFW